MLICLFAAALLFMPTSNQSVSTDLRDISAALLKTIDPGSENVVLASRSLDRGAAAALRAVRPSVIVHTDTEVAFPLPDFVIVIDSVTISGADAVVRLRRGPVPADFGWVCGQAIAVPFRRTDKWSALAADEFRWRCAIDGPRGLPVERDRLLEAARLAFSMIHLGPRVQVTAGAALSPEGLATLETIKQVSPRKLLETEKMSSSADVFVVTQLDQNADLVEFAGTLGDVRGDTNLNCGINWTITLRRHSDGWTFEKSMLRMC